MESSASNKLFDDLLSAYYTPLEVWYTRSAVDKVLSFFYFKLRWMALKAFCRHTAFRPQKRLHHQQQRRRPMTHSTFSRLSSLDFSLQARLESSSGRPRRSVAWSRMIMRVQFDARWTTYIATRALDEEKKSNVRVVPLLSCVVTLILVMLSVA